MNSSTPTADGFRILLRRPSIPLAEVAWRWCFGAAVWFLGALFLLEYADSLPVTATDRLLLGTNQPALVWRAIHRIFQGSAFRFTEGVILLVIALTIAWIVLSSLARAATLKAILEELGMPVACPRLRQVSRSLSILNLFRVSAALATLLSCVGAAGLASSVWAATRISGADAARLWFALLFLAWLAWSALNWLLSTASLFVVARQDSALQAIASTVDLCQMRSGAVLAAGAWFGMAHGGAFMAASLGGLTVFSAIGVLGFRTVLFLEILIVLVYSIVADFLYAGRLAACAAIVRGQGEETSESQPDSTTPPREIDRRSPVDQSELILSDAPIPAI
jgi:hypothetical protein